MRHLFKTFFIAVICVSLSYCAFAPKKKPPVKAPVNAQTTLKKVQGLMAKKRYAKGLKLAQSLANQFPETDIADDALMIIGDHHFKRENYSQAYTAYMQVADSEIFSPNEALALYQASRCLQKKGQLDESLALVQRSLKIEGISLAVAKKNHLLAYQLQDQLGDKLGSLDSLAAMIVLEKDPSKKKSYVIKAIEFVETRLSDKELQRAASQDDLGEVRAYAYFKLGTLRFEQKDFRRARSYFDSTIDLSPNSDLADQARQQIYQIDARRKVDYKTVGAILPLSGRHANVAYRTLHGLQLGLGIYGRNPSNFKLAIVDSEGNPDAARRGVERLVTEDHVVGLVGSLLSKTSVAVASKAEELGVPSIALSQKAGLTDIGESVFRNSLTSGMQVHQLVKVAMEDYGMKKFAILYPNDAYGVEYTNLFWDAVLARGGQITAAQAYDSKSTNFADPIRRLVGTYYLEDREPEFRYQLKKWYKDQKIISKRKSPPDDILPPVVDFDAIFIPDSTKALGQIAPTMAYLDIQDVKLLGTNLWNTKRLIRMGQGHSENTLFVDSILSSDKAFRSSPFFKEFVSVFGTEPGIFEAQAYDAAMILREAIASGESSRVGVQEWLTSRGSFTGSIGALKINPQREILRPVVALTVHEKKILKVKDVPPPPEEELSEDKK